MLLTLNMLSDDDKLDLRLVLLTRVCVMLLDLRNEMIFDHFRNEHHILRQLTINENQKKKQDF